MVGRDVEENADLRFEGLHIFQLKTTQLTYIPTCLICRQVMAKTFTHIAHFGRIDARRDQEVMTQTGRRRLPVTSGDPNDLTVGITIRPLDLADDVLTCCEQPDQNIA